MGRRDGVGRRQRERHDFLKFGSETDLVEKLEEAAETVKGRYGFGRGSEIRVSCPLFLRGNALCTRWF
jgi:hypothetical protein